MLARKRGGQAVFAKYAATNMAILILPILLAALFYGISARTVRDAVDRIAEQQLAAGAELVDRRLSDLRRAEAQLEMDYDVNFYLNTGRPYSPIEAYDLRKISDKLSSLALGNDLLSHLFLYFSGSDYLASEAGASPYSSFYGTMLSVELWSAQSFREEILRSGDEDRDIAGVKLSFAGKSSDCLLSIHPIGHGSYRRGAIVGAIDSSSLIRLLAEAPQEYGGWIAVYDGAGGVVASSDPAREKVLRAEVQGALGPSGRATSGKATFRASGASYRLYVATSSVADWSYVAALDESRVLAGPRALMRTALLVLAACFAVGTAASYWFARTNARPVDRMIRLVLGESSAESGSATSLFQQVEEAIVSLSDEKRRLEGEVAHATEMARANFLQSLLIGGYRDRSGLALDASRFGVELSGERLVMIAGIGSAGVSVNESGAGFAMAIERAASSLGQGEYAVPISPGEAAFILCAAGATGVAREASLADDRPKRLAEAVRAECPSAFRGALSFGAGQAVSDPFLLPMSLSQAESARSRASRAGSLDLLSYGGPEGSGGCAYPLDLEEAVIRAVRSANVDLLRSLLGPLSEPPQSGSLEAERDVAAALRGTALRLFAEFPKESAPLAPRLGRSGALPPPDAIAEAAALLEELARGREGAKRSHNSALAEGVRSFIAERFGDRDLGLAMVAERFRISENYLSNLYKEQTGECVSETIEATRIAAAKQRLAMTQEPLDRIAVFAGYRSDASFRRAFKRVVGCSPSDYRDRSTSEST
jgi:AraC-type DNA-binding domain-containing proteins